MFGILLGLVLNSVDQKHEYLLKKNQYIVATFCSIASLSGYVMFTLSCSSKSSCNEVYPFISIFPVSLTICIIACNRWAYGTWILTNYKEIGWKKQAIWSFSNQEMPEIYIFFRLLDFFGLETVIWNYKWDIPTSLHGLENLVWSFSLLNITSGLQTMVMVTIFYF